MLSIAVCDDSPFMRGVTRKCLTDYSFRNDVEMQIYEYESGELLLADERSGERAHDLIFIDYEFEDKGKDGISIIRELRELGKDTKVIFLSSYSQVVFQSFEVETFRFLVKPLDEGQLFKAMDDFLKTMGNHAVLSVRIDGEEHYYKEEAIAYIEGFGKNCILHFSDGREAAVCQEAFSVIADRVSDEVFFRCHRSFLVNMGCVDSCGHAEIVLDSGASIPISRNRQKEFGAALTEYISRRRGI